MVNTDSPLVREVIVPFWHYLQIQSLAEKQQAFLNLLFVRYSSGNCILEYFLNKGCPFTTLTWSCHDDAFLGGGVAAVPEVRCAWCSFASLLLPAAGGAPVTPALPVLPCMPGWQGLAQPRRPARRPALRMPTNLWSSLSNSEVILRLCEILLLVLCNLRQNASC